MDLDLWIKNVIYWCLKNEKKHYSLFYDDDMIEVVYKLCKEDINNFKYNFEYGGTR